MIFRLLLVLVLIVFSSDIFAKKVDGKTVPIASTFSGYLLGFDERPEVIAARCTETPAGKFAWAVSSFAGWGTASHLGESYMYAEHCSYGTVATGPDGTYGEGEITTIADNGDILLGAYTNGVSLSPPPNIGFMDQIEFISGGTGRFTFASGGGFEMGVVDFNDFSFTVQMTGVIAYKRK